MIIFKTANQRMISELISAMCLCFNEPEETVKFFFENKFKPKNCFICTKNNNLVAMLHVLPQKLVLSESFYTVSYIYGACTLPEYRKKGYMSKLLKYTEAILKLRGFDFSVLVPENKSLENFYKNLGYCNFFKTRTVILDKYDQEDSFKFTNNNISKYSMEKLRYNMYNNFNGIAYTQKDIDYAMNLYKKYGGDTLFVSGGYAICEPISDFELEIKDFTCYSSETPELLSKVFQKFPNHKRFIIKTNPANSYFKHCKFDEFHGMIKSLKKNIKKEFKGSNISPYLGLALD